MENNQPNTSVPEASVPAQQPPAPVPGASTVVQPDAQPITHGTVPPKKKRPIKLIIGIVVVVFLALFLGSMVMIAYGALPVGNAKFRTQIADMVQGLPFMPKTPDFIARKALAAVFDMKKFVIDASFAMTDPGISESFGMSGLVSGDIDVAVKGPVDFSDPNKMLASLNISVTKDFNTDLRLKENFVYFKINKIPSAVEILMSSLGLPDKIQNQFMNKWFYYDATPLSTEAREQLEEANPEKKSWEKEASDRLDAAIRDGKIKPKVTMGSEAVDGSATYKMATVWDKKAIDALLFVYAETASGSAKGDYQSNAPTLTEMVDTINMTYWIDKKTYYIRKVSVAFTMKVDDPSSGYSLFDTFSNPSGLMPAVVNTKKKEIPVTFVAKYSDIGKTVTVETPKDAVKFEEFLQKVIDEQMANQESTLKQSFDRANNTKRQSDVNAILNAVNQYAADNKGELPPGITGVNTSISKDGTDLCTTLVPEYLAAMPADPFINVGTPIDEAGCLNNYYTGYTIQQTGSVITVTAPYAELGETISVSR
jgi:hypothetical protein